MTTTNCKFNCTCIRIDCPYKHHIISFNDRKDLKELYNRCFNDKIHYESNYKQKIRCPNGLFCQKEDCPLKHLCNYKGRIFIIERWNNYKKEKEKELEMIRWKMTEDFDKIINKYKFEENDKKFIQNIRSIVLPPL